MVSFVTFAFISALIFKISFLLLTLGFFISSFSSCFRCRVRLFIWLFLGWQPGGATPHPRPGVAAGRSNPMSKERWLHGCRRAERSYSTFKVGRGGGQEELPHVQGQKWRPGGATPHPRSGAAAQRSYPASEARGSIRGQGQRPGGETPPPRSSGCMGARGPRGSIPCSKSEGAAVRRYPSSKVRSNGCALLEQL